MRVTYTGTWHAQISATIIMANGEQHELSNGLLGCRLAGCSREWLLNRTPTLALSKSLAIQFSIHT